MYKCKYFKIQEVVPPQVFHDRGEKAWQLLDDRILRVADLLREQFGTAIVNNWHVGGDYQWSGLRTPDSPYYSPYSQHTCGRALDIKFSNATAEEVRTWIKENEDVLWDLGICVTLEEGVSWLHVDVRSSSQTVSSFWP